MKEATKRSILRWIHLVFSIPILGYIYDSPSDTHNYAPSVRYVFVPVLLLSGLWMWKGHVLRRLISNRSAHKTTPVKTGQELEA
jgi:hypothetical protein